MEVELAVSGVGGEERGKEEGEEGEGDQEELSVWEAVKSVDSSTRYTAALPHVTYTNIYTTFDYNTWPTYPIAVLSNRYMCTFMV